MGSKKDLVISLQKTINYDLTVFGQIHDVNVKLAFWSRIWIGSFLRRVEIQLLNLKFKLWMPKTWFQPLFCVIFFSLATLDVNKTFTGDIFFSNEIELTNTIQFSKSRIHQSKKSVCGDDKSKFSVFKIGIRFLSSLLE